MRQLFDLVITLSIHPFFRRSLVFIWCFAFVLSLTSIVLRIIHNLSPQFQPEFWIFPILLLLAYFIFLLEGAQSSIIKLEGKLEVDTIRPAVDKYAKWKKDRVYSLLAAAKCAPTSSGRSSPDGEDFLSRFLNGRQVFTLLTVVLFAELLRATAPLQQEGVTAAAIVLAAFPSSSALIDPIQNSAILKMVDFLVLGSLSHYLIAGLLLAWFSQLVPKLLSRNFAIGFFMLPGATWIAALSVLFGKLEAGWIASRSEALFGRMMPRDRREEYEIGLEALYNEASDLHRVGVVQRDINVVIADLEDSSTVTVNDATSYELRSRPSMTVRHAVRMANCTSTTLKPGKFVDVFAPDGKTILDRIEVSPDHFKIIEVSHLANEASPSVEPLFSIVLHQQMMCRGAYSLEELKKSGVPVDEKADYIVNGRIPVRFIRFASEHQRTLEELRAGAHEFEVAIDVVKPTRQLQVSIECADGIDIDVVETTCKFVDVVDGYGFEGDPVDFERYQKGEPEVSDDLSRLVSTVQYPPVGSHWKFRFKATR